MSVWQWGAIQNRGIREKGSKRGSLVAVTFTYVSSASNEQRLPRTVEVFCGVFFVCVPICYCDYSCYTVDISK